MKKLLTLLVPCVVLVAAIVWWKRDDPGKPVAPPSSVEAADAVSSPLASLQATPQAQEHLERQRFEADAKDFFARSASLRAVERSERADALTRQFAQMTGLGITDAIVIAMKEAIEAPVPGKAPKKLPIPVPRSMGMMDCRTSCRVGIMVRMVNFSLTSCSRETLMLDITSATPKTPMASATRLIPSVSSGTLVSALQISDAVM